MSIHAFHSLMGSLVHELNFSYPPMVFLSIHSFHSFITTLLNLGARLSNHLPADGFFVDQRVDHDIHELAVLLERLVALLRS